MRHRYFRRPILDNPYTPNPEAQAVAEEFCERVGFPPMQPTPYATNNVTVQNCFFSGTGNPAGNIGLMCGASGQAWGVKSGLTFGFEPEYQGMSEAGNEVLKRIVLAVERSLA